ncbi:MAG: phage terminase large subunit [Dehalococcoidia bacterium]|jgi:phage terminase large subunit-like protein|nr:phage terminase large subunit [Dehalococcoidia bacterium]
MPNPSPAFEKTAKQRGAIDLLASPARNVMLYGGSRSGKTFIILYALVVRALKAKSRHLILRFRFNHAKASIWHETLPKVIALVCPDVKVKWNNSDYFITFPNGSEIWIGGLDEKDRTEKILGTEWSTIFFNECSQITHAAVEMALTRLAENSGLVNKALFDCNPPNKKHWTYLKFVEKRDPSSKAMLAKPDDYGMMLMNPEDNRENLPEGYIEDVLGRLSQRNRQRFLLGMWLDVAAGALWNMEMIKRLDGAPECERIVVAVDPAASSGDEAESKGIETGIIVAGKSGDRFVVLDDLSGTYTPDEWGTRAIEAYYQWRADRVVGERNNGGDMVEDVIHVRDPNVAYDDVWASQGKSRRAEPVAALYEQGRGYHVGVFPDLEDQMVSWVQGSTVKDMGFSPDRMDSMVWGCHELMLAEGGDAEFVDY